MINKENDYAEADKRLLDFTSVKNKEICGYDANLFAKLVQSDERINVNSTSLTLRDKDSIKVYKSYVDWLNIYNDNIDVVNRAIYILIFGFNESLKNEYCNEVVCYPVFTEDKTGLVLVGFVEKNESE